MMSPIVSWVLQLVLGFVLAVLAGVLAAWIFKVLQKPSAEKRFRRLCLVFVIVFGLVLIALIVVLAPRFPPAVPNLVDLGLDQAQRMAEDRGVSLSVNRQYMVIPEKDRVARQDPPPGTRIAKGGKIAVTVSAGAYPQVVGKQEAEAVAELHKAGLDTRTPRIYSVTQGIGTVIKQEPESGEDLHPGDKVTITVSRGLPPQRVEIRGVKQLPGTDNAGEVTVRVCGFPEGSVVLAWVEEPNDAYYPQERAEFHYPDPDVAVPQEYHLRLRYAFRAPPADKSVHVTVHPPGCALSSVTVFEATHRNLLLVSAGPLQFQLEREGYKPLEEAEPRSVHSSPPPDTCRRCDGRAARQ